MDLEIPDEFKLVPHFQELNPNDYAEQYDRFCRIYDRVFCPFWPDEYILEIITHIKKWPGGDNIIEVGVGTGNIAGALYVHGYHNITGVDFSQKMLERLHRKFPKIKPSFQSLDTISFKGYDWIIMVGMILDHIKDKRNYFKKMYEQADPGTFLFINIDIDFQYFTAEPNRIQYSKEAEGAYIVEEYFVKKTRLHRYGMQRFIDKETNDIFVYHYSEWRITLEEICSLLEEIGFKKKAQLPIEAANIWNENLLVFQK